MTRPTDRVVRALRELASEAPVKMRVAGDCMAPLAANGALLEISRKKLYWPGDVIAFHAANGGLLLHRLIGFSPRAGSVELVTQGDACCAHDAPVRAEQVIGKVSGGECAREMIEVPLAHRVRALGRFFRLVVARLQRALQAS